MFQRFQVQLTVLFIAFVLLVLTSVGVTYWGLQAQQQDALVTNLAGRQRMLADGTQLQGDDKTASAPSKSLVRPYLPCKTEGLRRI